MTPLNKLFLGLLPIIAIYISGCSASGIYASGSVTQVHLASANYNIVATSLSGSAQAEYLFGMSFGAGMYTQAYALIPLTRDRALYKLALEDLWRNFDNTYGSSTGRQLAMVNVRYDTEAVNVFFYTRPRLTIVADIIEFTE